MKIALMLHFLWRFLVYRANENRKRCALLIEVTQKDPRNIENFKIKTTGKKQMMFCIACLATKWSLSMMQRTQIILCYNVQLFENLRVKFLFSGIKRQLIQYWYIYPFISLDYRQLIKFNYNWLEIMVFILMKISVLFLILMSRNIEGIWYI